MHNIILAIDKSLLILLLLLRRYGISRSAKGWSFLAWCLATGYIAKVALCPCVRSTRNRVNNSSLSLEELYFYLADMPIYHIWRIFVTNIFFFFIIHLLLIKNQLQNTLNSFNISNKSNSSFFQVHLSSSLMETTGKIFTASLSLVYHTKSTPC